MALDYFNDDRSMIMACDQCQDESTFYGAFKECIEEAKQEGWLITKNVAVLGEYTHTCPCCQRPGAKDDFPEAEIQ